MYYLFVFIHPILFVSLLYLIPQRVSKLPRDAPEHMLWRFGAVLSYCAFAPILTYWMYSYLSARLGKPSTLSDFASFLGISLSCNSLVGIGIPLFVIATLFLGPLCEVVLSDDFSIREWPAQLSDSASSFVALFRATQAVSFSKLDGTTVAASLDSLDASSSSSTAASFSILTNNDAPAHADEEDDSQSSVSDNALEWLLFFRSFILAPVSEEWVFRCNTLPLFLLCGLSPTVAILASAATFGVAHVHHIIEQRKQGREWRTILMGALLQLTYTSVFGAIAGIMLYNSGSAIGIILMHAFCNKMGLPSPGWIHDENHALRKWRVLLITAYAGGIVAFFALLTSGVTVVAHTCLR